LQHDALLQVYDCGTATINEKAIIYCVHEPSDGDLENALACEPLETDAALELVGALLRALVYLHAHGLVCSGIDASEVHACGSSTKLFPQRLRQETALAEREIDLRSLGKLVVRVTADRTGTEDPRLRSLAVRLLNRAGRIPSAEEVYRTFEAPRRTHVRASGIVAVLLALALFFGARNYYGAHQPADALPPTVDRRPSPIDSAQPPSEPEEIAPTKAQRLESAGNPSREQERSRSSGSDWGVIAATYKSFDAAQRRAKSMKDVFGDCTCSVYPRNGEGQNYYVVVASNLTQEAAEVAQKRAIAAGLPEDTYVTRIAPKRAETPDVQ
jgi:hypothetical protein